MLGRELKTTFNIKRGGMRIYFNFDGEIKSGEFYEVDHLQTFGGEFWDDDFHFQDYGIALGDLTITSLSPETMKKLGVEIINHLIINGHRFEIRNSTEGNGEYLKAL